MNQPKITAYMKTRLWLEQWCSCDFSEIWFGVRRQGHYQQHGQLSRNGGKERAAPSADD